MIVVAVINFPAMGAGARCRDTLEMRIKMRVDQSGMIVIRSRSVPCVYVLERRQKERQQQRETRLNGGEAAHRNLKCTQVGDAPRGR